MAGLSCPDRALLSKSKQERRPPSLSTRHEALGFCEAVVANSPDSAVVQPQRSRHEKALIEVPTMRRFVGIDLISDGIPDETTMLTFRHLLEQNELGEQIHRLAGLRLRDGEKPSQGARHGHEGRHEH